MVKFVADLRVAFVVNFVARKKSHVRTNLAPVQDILSIFDFDVSLSRPDDRAIGVGSRKTVIQVGSPRLILQLPGDFEWRRLGVGRKIDPEKFAEPEIGILQLGLGVDQFRPLVGQRHLRPLHIQRPHQTRPQPFLLVFRFFLQRSNGIFAHPDLRPIQERFVERDPRLHRHAIDRFLKLALCLVDVQARNRDLARDRATGVKVLQHPQRSIVILIAQPRLRLMLPFVDQSGGDDRR